jgi:hypothetical protein
MPPGRVRYAALSGAASTYLLCRVMVWHTLFRQRSRVLLQVPPFWSFLATAPRNRQRAFTEEEKKTREIHLTAESYEQTCFCNSLHMFGSEL